MKKLLISIVILVVLVTGCAPGSSVEVNTPESTIQLTTPGPNPELDKPAAERSRCGRWAGTLARAHCPCDCHRLIFQPRYADVRSSQ